LFLVWKLPKSLQKREQKSDFNLKNHQKGKKFLNTKNASFKKANFFHFFSLERKSTKSKGIFERLFVTRCKNEGVKLRAKLPGGQKFT
jgi:hypothetical protein